MKNHKLYLSTLVAFFMFVFQAFSQVYVDMDATGANDGSSWENAYTDLSTPLGIIAGGSIWVAEGTYIPGSGSADTLSSFFIRSSISLYGGFNGTETMLDQRDYALNETILSGDVLGDDLPGMEITDFMDNRTDNVHHVVKVDSLLFGCTIDGFTISGGHTSNINDQPEVNWRGGGIITFSLTEVRNCYFTKNFARSGGGIYFSPNGGGSGCNGSVVDNCTFGINATSSQGAGIFAAGIDGLEVKATTFVDNLVNRGAFYPVNSNNIKLSDCIFTRNIGINTDVFGGAIFSFQNTNFEIRRSGFSFNEAGNASGIYFDARGLTEAANFLIDSCTFENNTLSTSTGFGGVIYNWQGTGLTISNSNFKDNAAGNGAILYHDGRQVGIDAENLIIDNCSITNNQATDFGGGAIYVFEGSMTLKNSSLRDNIGLNGSHAFFAGTNKDILITDSEFAGGESNFGGACALYGLNSNYVLFRNSFTENSAANQGGALIIGFRATANINECDFNLNEANLGGAVRIQNDSTFATFDNCLFQTNNAIVTGGAIFQGGGSRVNYLNSDFFVNTSQGDAGALQLTTFNNDTEQGAAQIANCTFNFNSSQDLGGGISIVDMPTRIANTLIHDNLVNGPDGIGGGIYFEVSDSNTAELEITNTTLANNFSTSASGIGLFRAEVETSMSMLLQNTLNFNSGENFAIISGDPILTSVGGNLSSDESGASFLTTMSDQNSVADAMFVDPVMEYDFHLSEGSPAINAGVSLGAPTTDIEGTMRFDEVDSGAYEFDPTTSLWDVLDNSILSIAPNPVESFINIELNDRSSGLANFYIYNSQGQLVQNWVEIKNGDHLKSQVELIEFVAGSYRLFIMIEGEIVSQQFVKL